MAPHPRQPELPSPPQRTRPLLHLQMMAHPSSWRMSRMDHLGLVLPQSRETVYMRDCGVCSYCGWPLSREEAEFDHLDGDHQNNDLSNVVLCCEFCHDYHHLGRAAIGVEASVCYLTPAVIDMPTVTDTLPRVAINVWRAAIYASIYGENLAETGRGILATLKTAAEQAGELLADINVDRSTDTARLVSPYILGGALVRFPLERQAEIVRRKLAGIVILPTDTRSASGTGSGGNLLDNRVASWRGPGGPFSVDHFPVSGWGATHKKAKSALMDYWRGVVERHNVPPMIYDDED